MLKIFKRSEYPEYDDLKNVNNKLLNSDAKLAKDTSNAFGRPMDNWIQTLNEKQFTKMTEISACTQEIANVLNETVSLESDFKDSLSQIEFIHKNFIPVQQSHDVIMQKAKDATIKAEKAEKNLQNLRSSSATDQAISAAETELRTARIDERSATGFAERGATSFASKNKIYQADTVAALSKALSAQCDLRAQTAAKITEISVRIEKLANEIEIESIEDGFDASLKEENERLASLIPNSS